MKRLKDLKFQGYLSKSRLLPSCPMLLHSSSCVFHISFRLPGGFLSGIALPGYKIASLLTSASAFSAW